MGTWGAGIYSGDTAQDLRDEYVCAFYKYSVNEALQKIDGYVREMFDETDEQEWCSYRYSLADFMWKKGILTNEVRDKTIEMIDSGFGLDEWAEAGNGTLRERTKVLDKLRAQLLSEQPAPKKIKPNYHINPIFNVGDFITLQLRTAGKKYAEYRKFPLSEEEFHSLDGKYIVLQKVGDSASWQSRLVPEICDYWARFRLFSGFFDDLPTFEQARSLPDTKIIHSDNSCSPVFHCKSSMVYFKRRKYVFLGNDPDSVQNYPERKYEGLVFWDIDADHYNPDSQLAAAIMRTKAE